jgi:hypothetical protein
MKLPFTMCLEVAGFSQRGRGLGRWYELRTSSPEDMVPMDCDNDGDTGSGGSLEARLVDDWLP